MTTRKWFLSAAMVVTTLLTCALTGCSLRFWKRDNAARVEPVVESPESIVETRPEPKDAFFIESPTALQIVETVQPVFRWRVAEELGKVHHCTLNVYESQSVKPIWIVHDPSGGLDGSYEMGQSAPGVQERWLGAAEAAFVLERGKSYLLKILVVTDKESLSRSVKFFVAQ